MKTKVVEVNNGVPMEVGVHGSDKVEKRQVGLIVKWLKLIMR